MNVQSLDVSRINRLDALIASGSLAGQTVLLKVDWNVPITPDAGTAAGYTIGDASRFDATTTTIQSLLAQGARVVVATHLGRPDGVVKPELTTRGLYDRARNVFGEDKVRFGGEVFGNLVAQAGQPMTVEDFMRQQAVVDKLGNGQMAVLENVRFVDVEEDETGSRVFAQALAAMSQIYVNEAFGVAHRAHGSNLVPLYMGDKWFGGGPLLFSELDALSIIFNPIRPLLTIIGGSKTVDKAKQAGDGFKIKEGKILAVDHFLRSGQAGDTVAIVGRMANEFLIARGLPCPRGQEGMDELLWQAGIWSAKNSLALAQTSQAKLWLPEDFKTVTEVGNPDSLETAAAAIAEGRIQVDIGDNSVRSLSALIGSAGTILFGGPAGITDSQYAAYATGTFALFNAVRKAQKPTLVIGGDSVAVLNKALRNRHSNFHFIRTSTGGGSAYAALRMRGNIPALMALAGTYGQE